MNRVQIATRRVVEKKAVAPVEIVKAVKAVNAVKKVVAKPAPVKTVKAVQKVVAEPEPVKRVKTVKKATEPEQVKRVKTVKTVKKAVAEQEPEPVPVTPIENILNGNDDNDNENTSVNDIVTPGGTRKRREVTPESVDSSFQELCEFIDAEITRLRDVKEHTSNRAAPGGGIKFLRSCLKRTRQLQNDVKRVAKKKRATRQGNNNSGFMKEAPISDEMANFLGVERGSSMSRVDCTRRLHEYIKGHDLQNPENRREIKPDAKLAKLLKYNKKSVEDGGNGPLFYYVMQKLIQKHFTSAKAAATPGA